MAKHTADIDRIDCRDLRADPQAGGLGRGLGRGDKSNLSAITLATARAATLRLIEPNGTVTDVPADRVVCDEELARVAEAKAAAEAQAEAQAAAPAAALAQALKDEEDAQIAKEAALAAQAQAKAQQEAEAERLRQAKEQAERAAAQEAKAQAERKAKEQAEAKAKAAAARKAKKEAEAKAKAQALAQARAKQEAEERALVEAERQAQEEVARKAKEKAEAERQAKAKRDAEKKAKAEAEAIAKRKAEEEAEQAAAAKAKAEAKEKARAIAEAKAVQEAEEKALAEAEKQAQKEAARKAKAEKKAGADARKKARAQEQAKEKARKDAEAKTLADAAEKAKALGQTFRRLIRETGPISLAHYMAESNARYYTSRDPLGEEGDFITAPEVSQMFGELIGLWFADLWVKMGARKHIHFVELGPGRGTLSQDALRTAARYDFAPTLHFVETSPALRKIQREAFPDVIHHDDMSTLPDDAPLLIVGNEFFDALPIHQLIRSANGWHERMVGLDGEDFIFVAGDKPMDTIVPKSWKSASQGTMIETSAAASTLMGEIATRLKTQGGAALIIDYGAFELGSGSTLQALKAHEKVDVFDHPGQADLTAHVDFEMLKDVAEANGADVMGVQMQGEWLRQMGIDVRTEALQRQNPGDAEKIKRQYGRLVDDGQMGTLFKVMGLCGRRWPDGEGFD